MDMRVHDLAAEIWAIAQTPPGAAVEDHIDRIYEKLMELHKTAYEAGILSCDKGGGLDWSGGMHNWN